MHPNFEVNDNVGIIRVTFVEKDEWDLLARKLLRRQ